MLCIHFVSLALKVYCSLGLKLHLYTSRIFRFFKFTNGRFYYVPIIDILRKLFSGSHSEILFLRYIGVIKNTSLFQVP